MTDDTLPKLVPVETNLPPDQAGLVENLRASPNAELAEAVYEALTAAREALAKVASLTQMVSELNAAVVTLTRRVAEDHQAVHRLQAGHAKYGPIKTSPPDVPAEAVDVAVQALAKKKQDVDEVWKIAFEEGK